MDLTKARMRFRNLMKTAKRGFLGSWEPVEISSLTSSDSSQELEFEAPVTMEKLESALRSYGVTATISDYIIGSAVTTYQVDFRPGSKLATLTRNHSDIARCLGVEAIRVNSSNGKVNIEIENEKKLTVTLGDILRKVSTDNMVIPLVLGEKTNGNYKCVDLVDMPHLLVAGATGSGKSVFLNTLICTILALRDPEKVRLLLIDPKQVEFQVYRDTPHLLEPIATDSDDSIKLLDRAIEIMEERFEKLADVNARNLAEYEEITNESLYSIVFVVDEYADLMLMGTTKERKEVEKKIARIAQKARAVGIHLVLATQKPLVTVVTSALKANLNARIAFSVASGTDSKVILDEVGAQVLTGKGDMFYRDPSGGALTRIQAPWIPREDINHIAGVD